MLKKTLLISSIIILVSACATRPANISASYVSHEKYIGGDCARLATQISDARAELAKVSKMQNSKANVDFVTVLLVLFPVSKLTGNYADDVAKWKGEVEAIETAQIENRCNG